MNLPFADAVAPIDVATMTSFQRAVFDEGLRQMADRIEAHQQMEIKDREKDDQNRLLIAAVLASSDAVRMISERVDIHQQAVIQALIENERRIVELSRERESMLADAYVLDDGRRVFKTEDGQRVYDEHGVAVSPAEIDPDIIPDTNPHWEEFADNRLHRQEAMAEREELFEYQTKLDQIGTQIQNGGLTQSDIDEIGALLDADAPAAVRAHLPSSDAASLRTTQGQPVYSSNFDLDDLDIDGPLPQ